MERPTARLLALHQFLIVAVAGIVFFTNLGAARLFDEDEPKNAVCGQEMFHRGDWLVPTFNDELRTDKPILIYWTMLCSFTIFGVNEFAARFGSAVLAIGTSLLTYHLGRLLLSPQAGLLASLILCTSLMFSVVGRAVTPDSFLIFSVTLALTSYCWAITRKFDGKFNDVDSSGRRRSWQEYGISYTASLPVYAAMGGAVLAKGPVGVLLPCAIIGLNLLLRQQLDFERTFPAASHSKAGWGHVGRRFLQTFDPRRIWAGMLAMRVPFGALVVGTIALPWYIAVSQATDGAWIAGFLGDHNVGRFLEAKENHSGPFFYYVPVILMGCFPWSVFLPLAIWRLVQNIRNQCPDSASQIFLASWAGFWILFFSGASTKLPNYILPAYPAVALLIASFLMEWQSGLDSVWNQRLRWSFRAMGIAGVALSVGLPIVTTLLLPGATWLLIIGFIPLAGAAACLRLLAHDRRPLLIRTTAITAALLAIVIVGIAPASISRYQDGPHFGRLARELSGDRAPHLATFEYFAPTLVFYAEAPVERLKRLEEIESFFADHPEGLLLTRKDRLPQISERLPENCQILAEQRRFLRRHDLVLLGRRAALSNPEFATAATRESRR